jgi:hypothetical protein
MSAAADHRSMPSPDAVDDGPRNVFRLGLVTMSLVIVVAAIGFVRAGMPNNPSPRTEPTPFRPSTLGELPSEHASASARGAALGRRTPG